MIPVWKINAVWQRWPGTPNLDPLKVAEFVRQGLWSEADLAPHGVALAEPFVPPDGKDSIGEEWFVTTDDRIVQVFDVIDRPPPQTLTPLQARRALRQLGLKAAVDAYVATLPEEAQEAWQYATAIQRQDPILTVGAAALGLTDDQIDDLFRLGSTL